MKYLLLTLLLQSCVTVNPKKVHVSASVHYLDEYELQMISRGIEDDVYFDSNESFAPDGVTEDADWHRSHFNKNMFFVVPTERENRFQERELVDGNIYDLEEK